MGKIVINAAELPIGPQEGDLSILQQAQNVVGADFVTFAVMLVALVILTGSVLYIVINKVKNKAARETIFLKNKKAVTYNRILQLYSTFENFPLTRKITLRLRREFEIIMPGDARFAKERATIIVAVLYGGVTILTLALMLLRPTFFAILCVCVIIVYSINEVTLFIVLRNEIKLLNQLQQFLSRFRFHYLVENTVDDAVYDAITEVPHLMQLHAQLILNVLQADADKQEEELLMYKNYAPNRFLKQFMEICLTTMQNGDVKIDKQSVCLTNVKNLKTDIEIELRRKKLINKRFAWLAPTIILPMFFMQAMQNWSIKQVASIQSFYYGIPGTLIMIFNVVFTLAVYFFCKQLQDPYRKEAQEHYILDALCRIKPIKKFVDNYWNRNYGKKLKIDNLMRRIGNTVMAEQFLLQKIITAVIVFGISIILFNFANYTTKDYVCNNYTSVVEQNSTATEEQNLIMLVLSKYYFSQYKNVDLLEVYSDERGAKADEYTEDVRNWFMQKLDNDFLIGGATVTTDEAIELVQQYNSLYISSTKLYTRMFGMNGTFVKDETNQDSVKAFQQLEKVLDRAAMEDPLINTDGLYDTIKECVYDKLVLYNKTYFHWWMFLLCVIFAVIGYLIPDLFLKINQRELQSKMEDEVIQFQSVIISLIYFDNVNVLTLLEWMNMFAEVFSSSIGKCITSFTMDENLALKELYENEPYEPFQRLVENLMMVDDVGVLQAFNELEATRLTNQENRKQDVTLSTESKGKLANILSMIPLSLIAVDYLIGPMLMESLSQMTKMVDRIANM